MKVSVVSMALGCSIVLAACGGGGSDGGDAKPSAVVSTASFPISGAVTALQQAGGSFTVSTVSSGVTFTLTITDAPGPQGSFEGHLSSTDTETGVLKQDGTVLLQWTATSYWQPSPYLDYGSINLSTGQYTVADVSAPRYLPATAKVGASGALNSAVVYANASKTTVVANITRTWDLRAATADTAYLCANQVQTAMDGSVSTKSDCYLINTSGTVVGHMIMMSANGVSLTFN